MSPGALHAPSVATTDVRRTDAWLFLVGDRAFNFKKPVALDFLDYGTAVPQPSSSSRAIRCGASTLAGASSVLMGAVAIRDPNGWPPMRRAVK